MGPQEYTRDILGGAAKVPGLVKCMLLKLPAAGRFMLTSVA